MQHSAITYDRQTHDYAVSIEGVIIGYRRTYREVEQLRTAALAVRDFDS